MITRSYINDIEVDEPQGLADLVLNINRDSRWHGVFFEASESVLFFTGDGAELLTTEKKANGLSAEATYRLEIDCGNEDVDVFESSFDFGTYREKCGNLCGVEISIEKSGCVMTMRNRIDQKVDLGKATAFDNTTLLPDYTGLHIDLTLTAQKILIGDEAEMTQDDVTEVISDSPNWVASDGLDNYIGYIAPSLPVVTNESLGVFNAAPIIELAGPLEGAPNRPPYPSFPTTTGTATLLGDITCELTDSEARFRLKGHSTVVISGVSSVGMTIKLFILPAGLDGTIAANWTQLYSVALLPAQTVSGTVAFDTGDVVVPLVINQGDFIYWGLSTRGSNLSDIDGFTLTFSQGSYYKLLSSATCTDTQADVAMVNEVGSRIIESITDACLTMKSDYYGRYDSQPYTSSNDGCGSLRVLSNGLKIRNATPSNHFISMQDYFDGLRAIDNIGLGIETNTQRPGQDWLRIEPVRYFYQDVRLLVLDAIPAADSPQDPTLGYSKIMIGYQKWEVERVNGLTEFNSNKEFRTGLKTIDSTLEAQSPFVAGGIPIEITRQQSFATSGAADTKYDNDTFIICVDRGGYDFIVEKGNIDNPSNIFSPDTVYNWRIRPMYNMMRWFKSIAQSYVNLSNTLSKLFFSSGTGNYIASGELQAPDSCKLEAGVIAENANLDIWDFAGQDWVPIFKPETITFDYPMSLADYNLIKENPYGYISYQCGNGSFEKGFIKTIAYKPIQGTATITLLKAWQ